MSRRTWKPRYSTAVRPRPARAPVSSPTRVTPGTGDLDTWPTPGGALARSVIERSPEMALTDLKVAREWVARWEADPPERRNRAYGAMRDYRDALAYAVDRIGECAWWNHFCNY